MKFNFYYKYFFLWLILIIIINYKTFISDSNTDSSKTNTITKVNVSLWNLKKSIEVVWNTQLVNEQSLKFNKAWTITKVNFKAWDEIKKWQTIAEIDNSDAYNSIDDATINLENAKLNLKQLYDWPNESNILQSKNSIITAQNNLDITIKELENLKETQKNWLEKLLENIENSKKDLDSKKTSLELSKKDLENLKNQQTNSLDNTKTNIYSTITNIEDNFKSNLVDIEKIIEESDYIMWVTAENKDKNDSFDNFLWAKDSSLKTQAKSSLQESISLYGSLKYEIDNYEYTGNKENILELLNSFLVIYNKLYNTTDLIYKTADSSIESVWSLSESDINSMKNSMSSYRNSSLSKISSINSNINTLKTLSDVDLIAEWNTLSIKSKEESIKSSELAIEKQELDIKNSINDYNSTKQSYSLALKSKENDLESKKVSLEISKLNLEELLEWPTEENIAKANNSIKQAQIKLQTSYESLDDYKLISPFDWVVRKIDYMPWDNLTNDTDKYVYIENPELLEISVMLDQIDIVWVEIWDEAVVTFDSYANIPVKAKVSSIDTTPIQSSWVISYEVKVVLADEQFNKKVLSWMTASVEIITENKENVLTLKTSAITQKNWKSIVTIDNNWVQKEQEVELWISSNWMTEILSWLKEGDTVIIWEFKASSTTTKWSSLFWTPPTWWWNFRSRQTWF